MKIIGLTGSIGMGKSVTARLLRVLKVPVFDSDACVHQLLKGDARADIRRNFPTAWNRTSQSVDREALARIIFSDPVAKARLESILHPLVWAEQQRFIAKCRRAGRRTVVLDIPLLYESGRDRICSKTICVTAPSFLQKSRVLSRRGMNSEKYKAILDSQMPDHDKRLLSDFVVPTGLGRAFTLQKLKKILHSLS